MKTYYSLFISLFLVFQLQAQVLNYQVGDVVDDFFVTDIDGDTWQLSELTSQGKYVYLDFFFVDCPPCWDAQPIFNEFYDKYGCNEGDLAMLSINRGIDSDQDVRDYEEEYGGPFMHAPAISGEGGSTTVADSFGIFAYPTVCLIGPDNTLLIREVWPINGVETFEETFTVAGINPKANPCTEVLGVSETTTAFNFDIVPNPTTGGVVQINASNEVDAIVTIYDLAGKLVFETTLSQTSTQLQPNLASGIYLVKLKFLKGATAIQKLVVR